MSGNPTYNMLGERFMDSDEIERLIRANVDKTVTVLDVDGEIQNLFVHSVDEEGFVCDIAAEMTQPPACAYWVRFTNVHEIHPAGDGLGNRGLTSNTQGQKKSSLQSRFPR